MTQSEFIAWLDGYLLDRTSIDAALIRQKMAEVKAPEPFNWRTISTPVFGMPPARLTSGDPMPIHPYTTCDAAGIPAVAGALSDGMTPLGSDFQRAIFRDIEALYEN